MIKYLKICFYILVAMLLVLLFYLNYLPSAIVYADSSEELRFRRPCSMEPLYDDFTKELEKKVLSCLPPEQIENFRADVERFLRRYCIYYNYSCVLWEEFYRNSIYPERFTRTLIDSKMDHYFNSQRIVYQDLLKSYLKKFCN